MSDNGLKQYKSIEEQLEDLKKEQENAERIYRGRMEMGALNNDPASVQVLAQTILDRKIQIEDLEKQIYQKEQPTQEQIKQTDRWGEDVQETSLTEYHRNPIVNWLQKIISKMEQISDRMEQKRVARENRVREPKIYQSKSQEYEEIINTNFSKSESTSKQKTAHELFVEKLSGNGAYQTFRNNLDNLNARTMDNPEKMQHIVNEMKKDEESR